MLYFIPTMLIEDERNWDSIRVTGHRRSITRGEGDAREKLSMNMEAKGYFRRNSVLISFIFFNQSSRGRRQVSESSLIRSH